MEAGRCELIGMREAAGLLGLGYMRVVEIVRRGLIPIAEVVEGGRGRPAFRLQRADVEAFDRANPVVRRRRRPLAKGLSRADRPPTLAARGYLSRAQAGRLCGVAPSTVAHWVGLGLIATELVSTQGGPPMAKIRRETIDAFIAAGMPRRPAHRPRKGGGPG